MNFNASFSKDPQIPNFMKIRPVGAELFHADGRTDMTNLIVAFPNFANASKSSCKSQRHSISVTDAMWSQSRWHRASAYVPDWTVSHARRPPY